MLIFIFSYKGQTHNFLHSKLDKKHNILQAIQTSFASPRKGQIVVYVFSVVIVKSLRVFKHQIFRAILSLIIRPVSISFRVEMAVVKLIYLEALFIEVIIIVIIIIVMATTITFIVITLPFITKPSLLTIKSMEDTFT